MNAYVCMRVCLRVTGGRTSRIYVNRGICQRIRVRVDVCAANTRYARQGWQDERGRTRDFALVTFSTIFRVSREDGETDAIRRKYGFSTGRSREVRPGEESLPNVCSNR